MPARHTTTLVAITRHRRGEKPEQMGSGVLVTLFGKYFLLSATHVLEESSIVTAPATMIRWMWDLSS
ncbi:hypothetical protein DB354_20105 [Opitutus sp. ER46]|nr:hypothetical protein DB354_20105 [Opitutus sp. ER46]